MIENVTITVEGTAQLQRDLRETGKSAQGIWRRAVARALRPMRAAARAGAPGRDLKRAVKVFTARRSMTAGVEVSQVKTRTATVDGREKDFSVVGNILEFGAPDRNLRARRFMRDARDRTIGAVQAAAQREIGAEIERYWQRKAARG